MMKKAVSLVLLGGALASGGCIFDGDAGPMTTKTVSESDFTAIELNGSADLIVTIGSEESVTIEGNEERVKNITTTVEDGVLIISEENEGLFGHSSGELKITVTAPSISAVSLSGSGDIVVTGATGDSISAAINGSGEINISGEVDSASLSVSGSGDIQTTDLKAKDVTVTISGSGDADVFASESITANVSGSGDITYIGGAENVIKSINGSGDVSAAD